MKRWIPKSSIFQVTFFTAVLVNPSNVTSSRSSNPSETMLTLVTAESWTWSWWCPTCQKSKLKLWQKVNNNMSTRMSVQSTGSETWLLPQFESNCNHFFIIRFDPRYKSRRLREKDIKGCTLPCSSPWWQWSVSLLSCNWTSASILCMFYLSYRSNVWYATLRQHQRKETLLTCQGHSLQFPAQSPCQHHQTSLFSSVPSHLWTAREFWSSYLYNTTSLHFFSI